VLLLRLFVVRWLRLVVDLRLLLRLLLRWLLRCSRLRLLLRCLVALLVVVLRCLRWFVDLRCTFGPGLFTRLHLRLFCYVVPRYFVAYLRYVYVRLLLVYTLLRCLVTHVYVVGLRCVVC